MRNLLATVAFLWLVACASIGQAQQTYWSGMAVDLPADQRQLYYNNFGDGGSCVWCSIGMIGQHQNYEAARTLLWPWEGHPRNRRGAGPSDVDRAFRQRGIQGWNVTGKTTWEWMDWACKTNRGAAIGAGGNHFQTLVGHDPQTGTYYVCNNNSPWKIDQYSTAAFRRLHLASGQWCVILDRPPPPKPPATRSPTWK